MRLTFAVGVAVLLACIMIGDIAPSVGEESVDRDGVLSSADDPLEDSTPEGGNRKSEELPEIGLVAGALEATVKKRGQAELEDAWGKGYRPNRRAFSPWGGKRYFSPWGGKRFRSIYLERKANSILDKRPGFQPWGGKRAISSSSELDRSSLEKRAFSPWGGKRESASRNHIKGLPARQRLNENKNLFIAEP